MPPLLLRRPQLARHRGDVVGAGAATTADEDRPVGRPLPRQAAEALRAGGGALRGGRAVRTDRHPAYVLNTPPSGMEVLRWFLRVVNEAASLKVA